jgi:hypothetical protein
VAAVVLAGAIAGWLALSSGDELVRWTNAVAGALACLLLGAGLALRLPLTVPLAVLALGAGYGVSLGVEGGALDTRAPALGAALFLLAELAYWSLELREAVADEPGAYLRRVGLLSALALGALAVGAGLLAVVDAGERGGVALEALGAVAAVAALAIVALATRGPREEAESRQRAPVGR